MTFWISTPGLKPIGTYFRNLSHHRFSSALWIPFMDYYLESRTNSSEQIGCYGRP